MTCFYMIQVLNKRYFWTEDSTGFILIHDNDLLLGITF